MQPKNVNINRATNKISSITKYFLKGINMEFNFEITVENGKTTKKDKIIAFISLIVLICCIYYNYIKKQDFPFRKSCFSDVKLTLITYLHFSSVVAQLVANLTTR